MLNISVDYLLGITNIKKPMPHGKIIDIYHGKECIDKAILPIAACAGQGELMGFVVQEIMQFPGVHTGDLVIVDQNAEYDQGDWVLYDAEGAYWLGEYYIRSANVILNIRISPHQTLPKLFECGLGEVVGKVVGTLQWHCRKR